jgi:hypothetical protein
MTEIGNFIDRATKSGMRLICSSGENPGCNGYIVLPLCGHYNGLAELAFDLPRLLLGLYVELGRGGACRLYWGAGESLIVGVSSGFLQSFGRRKGEYFWASELQASFLAFQTDFSTSEL